MRSQRTALALLLPVVLTSRLKTFVLGSAVSSGDRIAAVANATSGSTPLLGAIGAGAEGAAAAGVVTTAGAAGAVSAVGTSAGAVGSLATAGSGAYAVGVVAAPTAALATGLTAAGGGAGIFGALGGWGATGIAIKIALGAAAIAGGVVGATAKPGVLHPPTPIISSRNPVPTVAAAGAPANTAVPAVSGPAVLGGTLTASSGVWSGSPTFTYQWEDCDSSGENCSLIPGATSSSYVLASSDVGSTVKVLVSAANSAGSSSTASSPTAVIAGAPANTAVPAVSGSAVLGGTLTASNGVWSGSPAPTFTYQWEDCDSTGGSCSPIPGATASTYVLSSSDVGSTVKVLVSAANSAGSSSAGSSPTSVIAAAPANTGAPAVSGSAVLGGTLTASNGLWSGSPAPAFSYQWEDCDSTGGNCSPIPGATASTYVLANSDVGSTVKVLVSAANSAGSSSTASSPTAVIAGAPTNTAPPTVFGAAVLGGTLTASNGVWAGLPTPIFSYQWEDCDSTGGNCSPIPGATSASYTLARSDIGLTVRVLVSVVFDGDALSAGSLPTPVVADAPANTSPPAVSGSAVLGGTLTASNGEWSGMPAPTFTYQWEDCDSSGANCSPIPGATSSSYVLASSDVGSTVEVLVSAANSAGTSSAGSSPTAVVAPA
ncbi:MAG TPA: hypothetical protein VKR21_14660 [Solirubrobacteraceae bacterium]|nr:hypothetical protein [Solirubrobacteraceae bacterium]